MKYGSKENVFTIEVEFLVNIYRNIIQKESILSQYKRYY